MSNLGASRQAKDQEDAATVNHILKILHKWGIHTLGDFSRLEKEEIRARLGPEAVRLWERAQGQSSRLLKFIQPPESFIESFEFEYEVETVEPLLFVLRRFLQQIAIRLQSIYLVTKELKLAIGFANKQSYQRTFQIPQPTNDVDLLFRMLHTHLEDFKSEHPIIAVLLEAHPSKCGQQQFGLFETALRNPNQLYATLARLIALLGQDRVGTPVLEESYRPDAFHLEPFSWELPASERNRPRPTAHAALRRFRPSVSASILTENNRPIYLRSGQISGSAQSQCGPYLASGHWWDEKTWSRQEWDLELEKGLLARVHSDVDKWEIDGIYD